MILLILHKIQFKINKIKKVCFKVNNNNNRLNKLKINNYFK